MVVRYRYPCSVPIIAGAVAGAVEAFIDRTVGVTYQEISPDTVEIRVCESVHPLEMRNRLWFKPHQPSRGGIELRKCATCGGPARLSGFGWDPDTGIIRDGATGRRVALLGPPIIDTFLEELGSELGESVPEIVVEAQRRFVRNGYYPVALVHDQQMREQLALRGLGDLKELKMDRGRRTAPFGERGPAPFRRRPHAGLVRAGLRYREQSGMGDLGGWDSDSERGTLELI